MSIGAGAGPGGTGSGGGGSPGRSGGGGGSGGAVAEGHPTSIRDWLEIGADGVVTVYTGKVEVGQNIRTSLAQAVADELGVPLDAVCLVMADTERTPFDPGTFGSRSTPGMAPLLRRAAAAAREVLLDVAAERWEANRDDLQVQGGRVVHPETGQALGFGQLAQGQALAEVVPDDVPTLPSAAWRLSGTSAMKVGAVALVTGAHRYASDVKRPGMRYGKMLRPAGFGATLRSLDVRGAEALPGVLVVQDSGADLSGLSSASGAGAALPGAAGLASVVGVVGPDEATATRAVAALRAQWDVPAQPAAGELYSYLRTHPADEDIERRFAGGPQHVAGSVEEGIAAADYTLRQTYIAAYIAHAPLETRVAVAEWGADGQLTVWTGTQRPFGVRRQLAERFGLPEEQVRVIVPDTGSGYGGKHYGDAAIEAAVLARATGAPVRVAWTREEEFEWAYFRPAGVIDIRSGVRADGTLLAWEHHTFNAGPAGIRTPYEVPHQHVEYHVTRTPLRQGSYRALASTANHFARECHMD
ncbi:MAG: molybdopterin-dependent oxidoreductase, partial [Chloroflexota bacterium]|nr:molybdopterin-dependent oxidoreductase [Chloroflexota bacterium]